MQDPAGTGGDLPALNEWIEQLIPDPFLRVVALIAIALITAKILSWLLCSVLTRFTRRTKFALDDEIIERLHGPVFKTVVILGIAQAVFHLDLSETVRRGTHGALMTIVLLVWTMFAFRLVHLLLVTASRQERIRAVEPRTFPLFDNLGKVVVFGIAVYVFIVIWNIDPTGWLASAGLVGIALGFAAKDTLSNFIAGVFIIADAPYRVGDFIHLEDGTRGQVVHIGLRSTRLMTRDDIEVTVPNAIMGNTRITNEAGGASPRHRIRVAVGVAYGSDVDLVRRVLLEIAAGEAQLCRDPEPRVRFRAFGASALEFELLAWIPEPVLRGRVIDELNTAVYKGFAEQGIEIPFSQHDVYIREMPEPGARGAS